MKVEKKVNWIWQSLMDKPVELRSEYDLKPFYGKWQYTYENDNGKVGVSECLNVGINGASVWQVLGLEGKAVDIQHVLPTQEMAQATAYEMLGEKIEDN